MSQHCHFDACRSLIALEQNNTIIAVIEMSQSKWLVAALVPGFERQPLKKLYADKEAEAGQTELLTVASRAFSILQTRGRRGGRV